MMEHSLPICCNEICLRDLIGFEFTCLKRLVLACWARSVVGGNIISIFIVCIELLLLTINYLVLCLIYLFFRQ